ncbi:ExbD/TolR family protein [Candidatus Uabimicrobium amorphum]|uniref:Biopolymer transport protein ExbD n=1 Tax=Uabimicrobium amorphum TaxID=2596890 RepID=A0A5S9F829_UABAM|nr:biopolymer transporter ExbD [Candidatus Uabimicrobium amorphum]BBM88264.1 biopolymer transport protein ExbD [Candidatus Uabimicrobium amorphum]
MSDAKWHLKKRDSGKVYKDLDLGTLKTWILEARIEADDYVANSETKKWAKASSLKILQSYFAPSATGSDVISSRDLRFGWNTEDEESTNVDLTPMIDVTFLLLIFFMVTATFAVHEIANIKVPKAKNTKKSPDKKTTVSVDKDKNVFIGKQKVTLQELKKVLKQKAAQNIQQDVILAADRSIDWGFIISVLDEIKGSGIEDVKLKLEKKK